eukprot:CAMPEP_0114238910 /NCGR_PEP_ID=MMETSP0058-20121206/8171_1 /TAXON_ID=36894 /ORGANISM="Pyramimonas parkeae, CCMP726" /LENGTH=467 /DNA_ID=CAMNT_0001351041 /DNA_START=79 /DNA_END=1479 /DNA_ORIENTATION=-
MVEGPPFSTRSFRFQPAENRSPLGVPMPTTEDAGSEEMYRPLLQPQGEAVGSGSSSGFSHKVCVGGEGDDASATSDGTSVAAATFNLVTTVIGSGMMALPYVFKTLGLVGAAAGSALVCLVSWASACMLISASQSQHNTFGKLMKGSLGTSWTLTSDICVTLNNMGLLVVFLDIISDCLVGAGNKQGMHLPGLLSSLSGTVPDIALSRPVVMGIMMVFVIAPAALRRSFNSMKWTSMYSVCFAGFFVCMTAGLGVYHWSAGKVAPIHLFPEKGTSFLTILSNIPVIMSAFICHYNINPLMAELAEPQKNNMYKVVGITLPVCCALNMIVGASAVLIFGDNTQSDILQNLSQMDIPNAGLLVDIVRIGYIISLACTFPVILFTLRESLLSLIPWKIDKTSSSVFYTTSIVILVLEYVFMICVPNIIDVIELMASTVTMMIGFILPSLVTIKLAEGSLGVILLSSAMFW